MNADLAHDPDLGTWNDQTQSALCKRCRERVSSLAWVDGPCTPKNPEPSAARPGLDDVPPITRTEPAAGAGSLIQ